MASKRGSITPEQWTTMQKMNRLSGGGIAQKLQPQTTLNLQTLSSPPLAIPMSDSSDSEDGLLANSPNDLRAKYELLLENGRTKHKVDKYLYKLRRLILLEGMPPENAQEKDAAVAVHWSQCSLR